MNFGNGRRGRLVLGPDGVPITRADLPPLNGRWVASRKALVVAAVNGGLLTIEEACQRYSLALDEYLSWQTAIERHGFKALRTTKSQQYRADSYGVSAALGARDAKRRNGA